MQQAVVNYYYICAIFVCYVENIKLSRFTAVNIFVFILFRGWLDHACAVLTYITISSV